MTTVIRFITYKFIGLTLFLSAPTLSFGALSISLPTNVVGFNSIEGLLKALLDVFIVVATPIIIIFIIYGGFQYVTARGNAEQIQNATRTLTYAIIGGVLILGSVILGELVLGTVNEFRAN